MIVENDGIADTLELRRESTLARGEVMGEICHHLAPFKVGEKPIAGETVMAK